MCLQRRKMGACIFSWQMAQRSPTALTCKLVMKTQNVPILVHKKKIIQTQKIHKYNIANQLMLRKVMMNQKLSWVAYMPWCLQRISSCKFECSKANNGILQCWIFIRTTLKSPATEQHGYMFGMSIHTSNDKQRGINNRLKSAWLFAEALVHQVASSCI